jgi:heme A synthase
VVSIIACLPVLALRYGVEQQKDILGNTLRAVGGVVILLVLVAGWVRQRDAILAYFRTLKPPTPSSTPITESN